jgi:potassium-transporting ATPase KdpC subunit
MKILMRSLGIYLAFTALLGLVYPVAIFFVAQVTMPEKANGSLVMKDGKVAGSLLIGQNFTAPGYFNGRPSANNYDAANSGGTNLGPSSGKLADNAAGLCAAARKTCGLGPNDQIPADMVMTSASGLDPHITPANALLQAGRVSKSRGIPLDELRKMIEMNTDPDFIGIWGQPGVNVLKLNIAVDSYRRR